MRTFLLVMIWAAACGGGHQWDQVATSDAVVYRDLALQIGGALERHLANGTNAPASASSCRSEHGRYEGEVRPLLDRMSAASGRMDSWMRCTAAGPAEMEEGCQSMRAELDRHALAACSSSDATANIAELNRHHDAMAGWTRLEAEDASAMIDIENCATVISCGSCRH